MNRFMRFASLAGVAALACGVFAPPSQAAEVAATKLRFAAVFPPPEVSIASYGAKLWMDEVTRKTNGKITFQTFWGGALGKPAEHLTLVENGMADGVVTHRWYTPGKLPLGQFEYVFPFGPVDPVIVTKAKRQVFEEFPQFKESLSKYNALLIASNSSGPYQILSREPVTKLSDFSGKKISLVGRYFGRWIQAAGAVPVVAPGSERYTMLQTKVVDMDFLPLELSAAYKTQELAPHLIFVDALTACPYDILFSKKAFDKLPKEVQQIMIETGKEVELRIAQQEVPKWDTRVIDQFQKQGVKSFRLPKEERDKWASQVEDTAAEWAAEVTGQGFPGWAIVDRYQQITKEMGYQWPRKWGVKK